MSTIVKLKAASRARAGKGASRAVRREGLVPGVVYGDKKEPQLISLAYGDVLPHVMTGRFMATLVDLDVDGQVIRAIPRDIQFEPVRDFVIHVDFLRLGKGARIIVNIPVHFKNQDQAPGLKLGGALNVVSHEVPLYCTENLIPDEIMVDLAGMQVGQSVHLSQIQLPEGVSSASHDDVTLCAITSTIQEEEPAAEEGAAEVPATAQKAPAAGGKAAAPAAAPAAKKK
ncbi:MAG: 50S ribosomal protein L25/general stress protein Ctc [Alphaproteobacteria bacterium]|nr:50S ribosomal protein L25/general stress protein Ctc [Alphaproteobacteria bacterium]